MFAKANSQLIKGHDTSWETPGEESEPPEDEAGRFHVKKMVMLAGKKLKLNPKKARPGAFSAAYCLTSK